MTLNQRLIAALEAFGDPVVPGMYLGQAKRYYTFNYDLIPAQFSDNGPRYYRALIQAHFYCPWKTDSTERRTDTAGALVKAGFTWPELIDASDEDGQHYVFECEAIVERME